MRSVLIAALALWALGCQSDTFGTDAGPDGGGDDGSDDARAEGAPDANPQPCPFVLADGGDKCGQDGKCNAGDDCCIGPSQISCMSSGSCTSGTNFDIACRRSSECTTVTADAGVGQVCCLTHGNVTVGCPTLIAGPGAAACVLITKCSTERLCMVDLDCPGLQHCSRAMLDGNNNAIVGVCF